VVRIPIRSARVRSPVASANTVIVVWCRPNQGPLAARVRRTNRRQSVQRY
jgi:hypothetical protein